MPGRLLAFEQGDFTGSQKLLTLINKGKIRLLIEKTQKLHDLPLTSLSKPDQDYVHELVRTRREAAEAAHVTEAAAKK